MPRFKIYLNDETAQKLEERVKESKLSRSRVIANALKETSPFTSAMATRRKLAEMIGFQLPADDAERPATTKKKH
jgi:metal-responsive CopG/Arc/MetJ family transcriptional regulator